MNYTLENAHNDIMTLAQAIRMLDDILGDLIRVGIVDGKMMSQFNQQSQEIKERLQGMEFFLSDKLKDGLPTKKVDKYK